MGCDDQSSWDATVRKQVLQTQSQHSGTALQLLHLPQLEEYGVDDSTTIDVLSSGSNTTTTLWDTTALNRKTTNKARRNEQQTVYEQHEPMLKICSEVCHTQNYIVLGVHMGDVRDQNIVVKERPPIQVPQDGQRGVTCPSTPNA